MHLCPNITKIDKSEGHVWFQFQPAIPVGAVTATLQGKHPQESGGGPS